MSKFEDYTRVSASYDSGRRAAWADMYAGFLKVKLSADLTSVHVLDAGCGTGNYACALLEAGVGRMTLLDANPGMLQCAEKKLSGFREQGRRVEFVNHQLPKLPFEGATFDAVMINNVLHHLDKGDKKVLDNGGVDESEVLNNGVMIESRASYTHPCMAEAIAEAVRVLKPGGVLIVQTFLPTHAIPGGAWYYRLVPKAAERYARKVPNLTELRRYVADAGLWKVDAYELLGSGWHSETHDHTGPLRKSWRDTDSFWRMVTRDELGELLKKLEQMKEEETLKEHYEQLLAEKGDTADFVLLFGQKEHA